MEQRRLRAAALFADGMSADEVAVALGVNRSAVFVWRKRWLAEGEAALAAKPHPGAVSALSRADLQTLRDRIVDGDPRDFGYAEALWTREIIAEVVEQLCGQRFTPQWIGRLMRRLGLSPQRPRYRASEQDPVVVARWREQTYPAIRAEAAQVGATIYFGDEASISSHFHAGTTWGEIGKTPVVTATAKRDRANMVSAIEQHGRIHFEVSTGTFDAESFIGFCRKLLADDGGTVFLIVDNSSVHKAAVVKQYVAGTKGRLRLFFLPPYSPQLNPDEWVWKNVKVDQIGRTASRRPDQMSIVAREALEWLQQMPEIVRGFFHDPHLDYLHRPLKTV